MNCADFGFDRHEWNRKQRCPPLQIHLLRTWGEKIHRARSRINSADLLELEELETRINEIRDLLAQGVSHIPQMECHNESSLADFLTWVLHRLQENSRLEKRSASEAYPQWRKQLERPDRKWERAILIQAIELGWRAFSLELEVKLKEVETVQSALERQLGERGVLLWVEANPRVSLQGGFWNGIWRGVADKDFGVEEMEGRFEWEEVQSA